MVRSFSTLSVSCIFMLTCLFLLSNSIFPILQNFQTPSGLPFVVLLPPPSSLSTHPSTLLPPTSSLLPPYPSSLLPHPSSLLPPPPSSLLLPTPSSSFVPPPRPSSLLLPLACVVLSCVVEWQVLFLAFLYHIFFVALLPLISSCLFYILYLRLFLFFASPSIALSLLSPTTLFYPSLSLISLFTLFFIFTIISLLFFHVDARCETLTIIHSLWDGACGRRTDTLLNATPTLPLYLLLQNCVVCYGFKGSRSR